jgi:hypothetical protein
LRRKKTQKVVSLLETEHLKGETVNYRLRRYPGSTLSSFWKRYFGETGKRWEVKKVKRWEVDCSVVMQQRKEIGCSGDFEREREREKRESRGGRERHYI